MVWAAMGVFSAITSAVNHAWGVEKQPSYLKHKLMAFIMLIAASLLLLVGLLLVSAINVAEARWFAVILTRAPGLLVLQGWAIKSASTIIFIVLVGLIFYFVPNAAVRFRDVWVGAILTGLLWRVALAGFSRYVRDSESLQRSRVDCRGRRVPRVGVHLGRDPSLRGRGDCRVRTLASPATGRDSRRAGAEDDAIDQLPVSSHQFPVIRSVELAAGLI